MHLYDFSDHPKYIHTINTQNFARYDPEEKAVFNLLKTASKPYALKIGQDTYNTHLSENGQLLITSEEELNDWQLDDLSKLSPQSVNEIKADLAQKITNDLPAVNEAEFISQTFYIYDTDSKQSFAVTGYKSGAYDVPDQAPMDLLPVLEKTSVSSLTKQLKNTHKPFEDSGLLTSGHYWISDKEFDPQNLRYSQAKVHRGLAPKLQPTASRSEGRPQQKTYEL